MIRFTLCLNAEIIKCCNHLCQTDGTIGGLLSHRLARLVSLDQPLKDQVRCELDFLLRISGDAER